MKYDIKENNPDWVYKGPLYNTEIYSKLHGTVFEENMSADRIDRYNIISSITENDE